MPDVTPAGPGRQGSRLRRSAAHAIAFQKMSGTPGPAIVAEGLAMNRSHELSWMQVVMAADTPMMLRAGMVDGRLDPATLDRLARPAGIA